MKIRPSQIDRLPLKPTTRTRALVGMAFRPTDRVNIDTVEFTVDGIEWDVSDQMRSMLYTADGEIRFVSTNRLPVKGTYGMHDLNVRYSPIAKKLSVEGSLFGFLLGQNVFTSQCLGKGLACAISHLKKTLGFSFTVSMQQLIDEHLTLHRVDMAVNVQFESDRAVKTCLRQIVRQLIEQNCMVTKAISSVYWAPQNSRYYCVIFYDKGEDVRRKYLPKAKPAGSAKQKFLQSVCGECDALMRVEVRLRSAELKKRGLQGVKAWSGEAPKEIFDHYFRNVPVLNAMSTQLSCADLEGVPDRLRPVVALRKLNVPMELVYSARTMVRHRAAFRKLKIDLRVPATEKVVPLAKVLTASRIKPTPPSLKDARFAPVGPAATGYVRKPTSAVRDAGNSPVAAMKRARRIL